MTTCGGSAKRNSRFFCDGFYPGRTCRGLHQKVLGICTTQKTPVITREKVNEHPPYALSNSYELTHYVDLIDFPKPWDKLHPRGAGTGADACLLRKRIVCGRADWTILAAWMGKGTHGQHYHCAVERSRLELGEYNGWGKMRITNRHRVPLS
ncbi:MAG: hypothetical protein Ct9H300mP7_6820 [Verrucomicrobiota bacterium]|nr:MAG: hypothetical protein Ct9H300mP7_6820 [Verrucomicrobiota bacterium]